MEQALQCGHAGNSTIMKTSQCSNPDHFNKQYRICRNCLKQYNKKPQCYIENCAQENTQLVFNKQEYIKSDVTGQLFKAIFINLLDQQQKNNTTFSYGTLVNFIEEYSQIDSFQYTLFSQDLSLQANEDFMSFYNVPLFFQTVQLPQQKLLLTGGIYKIYEQPQDESQSQENVPQNLQKYHYSNQSYIFDFVPDSNALNFSSYNKVEDKLNNNQNQDQDQDQDQERFLQMNEARIGHQMVLHNELAYVLGGKNDQVSALSSVEVFDPKTVQWKEFAPMNFSRSRFAAISYVDEVNKKSCIYVIGGATEGNKQLKNAEKYDFELKKWIELEISGESFVSMGGFAFQHPSNNNMYIVGGVLNNDKASDIIFQIQEVGGKLEFKEIGKLNTPVGDVKGTLTKYYTNMQQQVKSDFKVQINIYSGYILSQNGMGIQSFEIDNSNNVTKLKSDSVQLGTTDQNLMYQANQIIPLNCTGRIER